MKYSQIDRLSFDDYLNHDAKIGMAKNDLRFFHLHWHNYFEYELVISGEGTHVLNNKTYHIRPGDVWLVNPSDFHEFSSENGMTIFNVSFEDNIVRSDLIKNSILHFSQKVIHFTEKQFNVSQFLLEKMHENYLCPTAFSKEYIENLMNCVLFELFSAVNSLTAQNSSEYDYDQENSAITKALLYLQLHFNENPSLQQISQIFGHNKNYFCEMFYKQTNMHYSEYLRKMKLDYAKNLLTNTGLPVTDICYSSGFSNLSSFLQAFKKEFGITPTQYRNKIP